MTTINNNDPIRILALEDEPVIADRIKRFCHEILGDRITAYMTCDSVDEALREAASDEFDLFLLDLNLQGKDGFEVLHSCASYSAQTIIISAYKERAVDAFDYGVVDFVAKPFDKERLRLALDRFIGKSRPEKYAKFLSFRSAGKAQIAGLDHVVYIAGADKYSEVHLDDGTKKLHDKSLNQFEKILPKKFERIHKSYIVCLDQIDRFETQEGSRYFVVLNTGDRLPIGRTRYKALMEKYL